MIFLFWEWRRPPPPPVIYFQILKKLIDFAGKDAPENYKRRVLSRHYGQALDALGQKLGTAKQIPEKTEAKYIFDKQGRASMQNVIILIYLTKKHDTSF